MIDKSSKRAVWYWKRNICNCKY